MGALEGGPAAAGMPAAVMAGECLPEALRLDATLARDPGRLRRALADLAPYDDRGGWLLSLGAATGAPALIDRGQAAEAQGRLVDACGCRPGVARDVVAAWAHALGRADTLPPDSPGLPPHLTPTDDIFPNDTLETQPLEHPGTPTALRIEVWPDGAPALALISMEGAFVLTDVRQPARGRWRRVADVRSPLSRDIAIAFGPGFGHVAWSDHDGVRVRILRRLGTVGLASLGGPQLLAAPPPGEQARYPLAALALGDGLSLLWTTDRRDLLATEVRAWSKGPASIPVPPACPAGERLVTLDTCLETERTAWLLRRTDRGGLAVARWDLGYGDIGEWQPLAPPALATGGSVARVGDVPFGIVVTSGGALLSLDLRAAAGGAEEWHSIDRPEAVREAGPATAVAAAGPSLRAAPGAPGWLALGGSGRVWAMPLARDGATIRCGSPIAVWVGAE